MPYLERETAKLFHDDVGRGPLVVTTQLLVRCIPRARKVVLDGLGHRTAIEDPERTGDELLSFLASIDQPQP